MDYVKASRSFARNAYEIQSRLLKPKLSNLQIKESSRSVFKRHNLAQSFYEIL